MTYARKFAVLAVLGSMLGAVGCHGDYLTGGELSTSPNRPTEASNRNLFIPIQGELWNLWSGDPARVTGIYAQEFSGIARQYAALGGSYAQDPSTTNGQQQAIYTSGGLVDIVNLENQAKQQGDTLFLGIAQITEGALMGTAADIFGDIVYSQALQGKPNPKPDDQLAVYDSVEKVLSAGIANLKAFTPGGTNAGPGPADLVYGGNAAKWIAMAYTLKARFYMHTAKVRGDAAYTAALAAVPNGISSDAGNYVAATSGSQIGESNLYYQFNDYYRGDMFPGGPTIDSLLVAHNDTARRNLYFTVCDSTYEAKGYCTVGADAPNGLADFGDFVNDPSFEVPLVTHNENLLIWAEAAYRTGDQGTALAKLNAERANVGADPAPSSLSGLPLLNEILNEEYVNDFGLGEEAWVLYNRTCTPNLVPPASAGTAKIPGRLYYDTGEQQTNSNLPPAGQGINGLRNPATPKSATSDGTGAVCLGQ